MNFIAKHIFQSKINIVFMLSIVICGLIAIYLEVLVNDQYRVFYDALNSKDTAKLRNCLLLFPLFFFMLSLDNSVTFFLEDKLDLMLRISLSSMLFEKAISKSDIKLLAFSDQRIAEDIDMFTSRFATIGMTFIFMSIKAVIFFIILWMLSPPVNIGGIAIEGSIALASIVYFILPTAGSYVMGLRLMRYENKKRRAEARMRYALISTLQQQVQSAHLRFARTLQQIKSATAVSIGITFLTNFINTSLVGIAFLIPMILLLPAYLLGSLLLGDLIKAVAAFTILQSALTYIHNYFREAVRCLSALQRLQAFAVQLENNAARPRAALPNALSQ